MSFDPFVGEIKIFAFNFPPKSHALCWGQIMSIAQNSALFALLGTMYGGNGQTTFALPDLRGRRPNGQGQGPGLPNYVMGQIAGTEIVTLVTSNMPPHVHTLNNAVVKLQASTANADETSPDGTFPSNTEVASYSGNGATPNIFTGGTVVSGTTDNTGSSIPVSILNPYLTMNYSIALFGVFPNRN